MPEFHSPIVGLVQDVSASAAPGALASLNLSHVLTGVGAEFEPAVRMDDIHLIRHTFKPNDPEGLRGPEDATDERVLYYTRKQELSPRRFPANPPGYWVVFLADGKRRSRLWGTFENHGEVIEERTDDVRCGMAKFSETVVFWEDRGYDKLCVDKRSILVRSIVTTEVCCGLGIAGRVRNVLRRIRGCARILVHWAGDHADLLDENDGQPGMG